MRSSTLCGKPFAFDLTLPTQLYFGLGSLRRVPEILGCSYKTALLVHDSAKALAPQVARVIDLVRQCCDSVRAFPLPEKGIDADDLELFAHSLEGRPDIILSLGGGTAIDAAKIIGLVISYQQCWFDLRVGGSRGPGGITQSTPTLAISTLPGTGTEISPAALVNRNQRRHLFVSDSLCPRYAIVDPVLACTASPEISVRTAIDALVQGIESYCTPSANMFSDLLALEAIRRTTTNLERVWLQSHDLDVRTELAYAALIGNLCIKLSGGVGAAHGLSNPLSARYGLHHGYCVALLLPSVMRFNGPIEKDRLIELDRALGMRPADNGQLATWEDLVQAFEKIRASVRLEGRLRDFGILQADLTSLGIEASSDPDTAGNPRSVRPEDAASLYDTVW
jgi:alcohol dehydrogenase class IV